MINQTQIITIFIIYTSLSLVLYLLKTIMGETKYNQYIKNNIYYIPLVQMFDNILNYDELILFKVILTSIIYYIIMNHNDNDSTSCVFLITDEEAIEYFNKHQRYPESYIPSQYVSVYLATQAAKKNLEPNHEQLTPPRPTPQ